MTSLTFLTSVFSVIMDQIRGGGVRTEIYSCFGADITHYSATNQKGQVLIPPYEVFKVTDVLTNDPWQKRFVAVVLGALLEVSLLCSPHVSPAPDCNSQQLVRQAGAPKSPKRQRVRNELWFLSWWKMAMSAVWAALLMTYDRVFIALVESSAVPGLKGQVPLDLAPNSVDDMYTGCKDKMEYRVKKEYMQSEKDNNFTLAWGEAEKNYNQKWNRKKGKRPSTSLGKEQIMAIYVYTLDNPNIYLDFNEAVRTQKHEYKTTFRYHALHFFLTDALQTLNARKPVEERCLKVYRRVNRSFSQDVLNKVIRFGSFTSSSMGRYASAQRFGDKSCFETITCLGADVSLFSKLGESEREVLIPPYEAFKVTKIERRSAQKTLPCENCAKTRLDGVLPLDNAPDSVDDMYDGCKDNMKKKVQTYLQNEKNSDNTFKRAWDEGEKYYQKRGIKKGKRPPKALGKEQAVAIYVYTLDNPKIYLDFNEAVRTQKHEYKTTFRYHTLHFFLTDALQTLNARKPVEERCLKVYRRVNRSFSQDVLNKVIRFGSFTSSSMGRYASAQRFGDKSCFEIITCLGADVSLFSKLGESEREVLIPPYEAFKHL
ncbi:hypothetical protein NQZ68_024606 [Dissostichus eleginoides]|nr:hypothetical protein NQZ68_024606 [Dissostichus eleginoides]